jgi:hypothetical protein
MNMVRGTAAPAAGAAALRRCPQDPQKAKAAPTVFPHFGQITVSRVGPGRGTPSPGVLDGAGTIPGGSGSERWAVRAGIAAGVGPVPGTAAAGAGAGRPAAAATPVCRPPDGETSTPAAVEVAGPDDGPGSCRRAAAAAALAEWEEGEPPLAVAEAGAGATLAAAAGAGAGAGAGDGAGATAGAAPPMPMTRAAGSTGS